MKMKILIPIATGKEIDKRVFEGLKLQSISNTPIICEAEGVLNSQRNYSPERNKGEERSRKKCQEESKKINDKYILLLDSDIILTDPNAIQDMINFLDKNEEVNAVALYFGKFPKITTKLNHVVIKCVLIRREIFASMDLTFTSQDSCFCNIIKRGCEDKIEYLDFKNRAYEIP